MLGELWIYLFIILLAIGFAVRDGTLVSIGGIGLVLGFVAYMASGPLVPDMQGVPPMT